MRKFLIVFLVVAVVIVVFLWDTSDPVKNYPSGGKDIIAFGDSLIYGVGSSNEGGFVKMLSEDLSVPIINLGVSGNTTADALSRMDDIFKYDPKIVMILLGGNDFLRRVPQEQVFDNLEKIIDKIHAKGAIVILLGVRGGILKDEYKPLFEDLAERKQVAYVPNVLSGIITKRELMFDGIHPNDKGYRLIADEIYPVLKSLMK